ncbi:phosphotriesterase-related protein [Marinobacterium halophilum]|uniref:Phosphotriesterase-related protein n=1 Tax=Marinobacterium halophilum TaxID=267374 RepID=A0A2P8EMZ8_9GAMM|nr:phosphotriesterase-related protein [Marinobacterium halophilum]PSL10845.1 phosphotriesterase-related protein [Marinobacterium halophilum]
MKKNNLTVNTVCGPIDIESLGNVLMHEHLTLGLPGWENDSHAPYIDRSSLIERVCAKIESLKNAGFNTLLDPCPMDLGRDIDLAIEVSTRTGFNIICATGLYTENEGGNSYWKLIQKCDPEEFIDRASKLFIKEITEGIGATTAKAGVIKIGSDNGEITQYEMDVIKAAAQAHLKTGTPITTHTDATIGHLQLQALIECGVPAEKVIIGHSCGNSNTDYHTHLAHQGAYVGFDRFGYGIIVSDDVRIENLVSMIKSGFIEKLIISHDCIFCAKGEPFTQGIKNAPPGTFHVEPTYIQQEIIPRLMDMGVTEDQIKTLLSDNPKKYFSM